MRPLTAAWVFLTACGSSAPPPVEPVRGYDTEGDLPVSSSAFHFDDGSVRLGPEVQGGRGVSLVDIDDDGWPDVTLTHRQGVRILRGVGGGRFELWQELPLPDARGLAWADVDDDGDRDLVVSGRSHHALFLNMGPGPGDGFRDATQEVGLGDAFPISGEGVSLGDLDGDGDLDLFLAFGAVPADQAQGGAPGTQGSPNRLYWNDGGHFRLDTSGVFAGPPGGETFQGALFDANRDGLLDVFMVHDHRADTLLLGGPGGVFTDRSVDYLPNGGTESTSIMGVELADIDQDGDLDVYGTQREGDLMYRGTDLSSVYVNAIDKLRMPGAGDPTVQSTGWGVAVQDFDNDGDQDVLRTSNFDDESEGPQGRVGINLLLEQESREVRVWVDRSAQAGAVFDDPIDGWGLATADIDRDGDLDALIGVDGTGPGFDAEPDARRHPVLLVNRGASAAANPSVRLRLRQPGRANRFAVGAIVELRGQTIRSMRAVQAGQSYLSQHDDAVHGGLGPYARLPAAVVTWPGGHQTAWLGLKAGEHRLERPVDDLESCCLADGEGYRCTRAPSIEACLGAQAAGMGLDDACTSACAGWRTCCPEIPMDLCVQECRAAPPPEAALQCLAQGLCDTLFACTDGGTFVPGNGTGGRTFTGDRPCPNL